MKNKKIRKSYIVLFVFYSILLITSIINSFVFKFLNDYTLVLFLFLSLLIFRYILGIEKDRNRYVKDMILEIIIYLLVFFLLYYLSGILLGFY